MLVFWHHKDISVCLLDVHFTHCPAWQLCLLRCTAICSPPLRYHQYFGWLVMIEQGSIAAYSSLEWLPNTLMCTSSYWAASCEAIRSACSSWLRYDDTTSWCSLADAIFLFELHKVILSLWKPIIIPPPSPLDIKLKNFLSPWEQRCCCQNLSFISVAMAANEFGRGGYPGAFLQLSNTDSLLV